MPKVMVGMSGGVDSSVAALILKKQGYEVVGATFSLWGGSEVSDAANVCSQLGIEHIIFDWKSEFEDKVIRPFVNLYLEGKTPNPCILCNKNIKFGRFLEQARQKGCDYISTGHYAQVEKIGDKYYLKKAVSKSKDQSYVLYQMTQEILSCLQLPLGIMENKDQIRAIAAESGLVIHSKPDSQDICFIPDGNHADFIESYLGKNAEPGDFINPQGKVIGRHKGIYNYTIGQRKGLGLSLPSHGYVCKIDPENNTVTVTLNESDLFVSKITAYDVNFINPLNGSDGYTAKIRYAHKGAECSVISLENNRMEITFKTPQRAPTKGQSVVIYDGEYVVGGGIIE